MMIFRSTLLIVNSVTVYVYFSFFFACYQKIICLNIRRNGKGETLSNEELKEKGRV